VVPSLDDLYVAWHTDSEVKSHGTDSKGKSSSSSRKGVKLMQWGATDMAKAVFIQGNNCCICKSNALNCFRPV
jgi:hypothetical protein